MISTLQAFVLHFLKSGVDIFNSIRKNSQSLPDNLPRLFSLSLCVYYIFFIPCQFAFLVNCGKI